MPRSRNPHLELLDDQAIIVGPGGHAEDGIGHAFASARLAGQGVSHE